MKVKIKLMTLLASLLAFMPVMSTWAATYYANLTVQASPAEAGKVYVSTSSATPADSSYVNDSMTAAGSVSPWLGSSGTVKFYASVKYDSVAWKFLGWSETEGGTIKSMSATGYSYSISSSNKTSPGTGKILYANFESLACDPFTVSFLVPTEGGTYTVDGTGVSADTESAEHTKAYAPMFVATPAAGYAVKGWYTLEGDAKTYFSSSASASKTFTAAARVGVDFVPVVSVTTYEALRDGLVTGDAFSIASGAEIVIPSGEILEIGSNKLLVNEGTIIVEGTLNNSGAITGGGKISTCARLFTQANKNGEWGPNAEPVYSWPSPKVVYWVTTMQSNVGKVNGVNGALIHVTFRNGRGDYVRTTPASSVPQVLGCTVDSSIAINHVTAIPKTFASGQEAYNGGYSSGFKVITGAASYTAEANNKFSHSWGTTDCAGNQVTLSNELGGGSAFKFINGKVKISGSIQATDSYFINCTSVTASKYHSDKTKIQHLRFFDTTGISISGSSMGKGGDGAAFYSGKFDDTLSGFAKCTVFAATNNAGTVFSGAFKNDPNNYLKDPVTYEAKQRSSDKYWVLQIKKPPEYVAVADGVEYEDLAEAIAKSSSGVITLKKHVELDDTVAIPEGKSITIDINGYNVSGGKIENSGALRLEDNCYQEVKGLFMTPVVNKKGSIDITYGQYGSTFTLEGGTLTTHGGAFTSTFAYEEKGGTANLRGGTYNCTVTVAEGHELVGNVLSETSRGVVICDNPLSAADISYTVRGLDPVDRGLGISDFDLYSNYKHLKTGWTTRSDFAGREALWDRLAELRSTVEPVESKAIEATMAFDRFVKAGSVSGVASLAGQTRSLALEDDVDANDDYHVFIPMVTGAGYYAISYKNMFNGEENDRWAKLQCGLKNNSSDNIGTVLTFKYQLRTQERAPGYTPQNPVYIETFTTYGIGRYMLGGKKAAIDRGTSRMAYDSLAAAVADVKDGERILVGADAAEDVTLAKAGTYTIDPYGFNFTGTVKVADGYTMNTSTAPSAADAQGVQSALATTYVVVDASVVEVTGGTKKYPSVAAAIAGETGNEIALTVTANVTETVAVPAGKKVTITVAEGVESKLTVNPVEGAFLVETKNGATTSYEAKRITEKPVSPTSGVSAKEVSGGNTNDVADASALVTRLMGNAAIERVDNTTVGALDKVEVTPTMIIDIKSGDQGVIEAATFDVVPKAKEGQSLGETMIKFRLPVEAATDKASAKVSHEGAFFGVVPVSSETVGETVCKFVEVTSNAFSPYGYELLGGAADPVAVIGDTGYATLAEAFEAVQDGQTIVLVKSCVAKGPSYANKGTVTFTAANEDVVLNISDMTGPVGAAGTSLVFKDMKLKGFRKGASFYNGWQSAGEYYEGCTIDGCTTLYSPNVTFKDCTFNNEENEYSLYDYAAGKLVLDGCTFNCAGKAVKVYNEGVRSFDVFATNTTFNASEVRKAAFQLGVGSGMNANIVVDQSCTLAGAGYTTGVEGGDPWIYSENEPETSTPETACGQFALGTNIVRDENGKITGGTFTRISAGLIAEGFEAIDNGDGTFNVGEIAVAKIGDTKYATLEDAFNAAQAGDTVTLLKDIEGVTNAFEITKAITLAGNGHKIVAAANENPRDMLSAYMGARVMFQMRSADGVTFQNLTVDGGATHYYTFLAETKGGVFTVENTQWLHGGEASAGDVAGVGYGAAIHVNGGILLANGSFRSYTGGKEAGVFPFTGILYDDGGIHFDDEAKATIGDDLLLVGITGAPDVSTEEGKAYVEELLAAMNVPVGFASYTLKLGDDSSLAFTGASPLGWNGIIDYGKQIMDVAGEIGYEGMDKEKTPVEVGLLTDTVLPEVFAFGDTNLTVNGNGNALSGEITYTDNAGFIEDIKLGAENPLVLDMTEVTKPVLLGSGIVVSNLIIKMTPEQAVAGTPVVTWSTDDGAVAPAVHSDVKVYLPTGETKDLIWDAEMGLAYIGPVEARLTGPTHEKPVYTSFAEAIAQAAESGDTVTLMTNLVDYVGTQGINKSLTLDGAGHKIVAKPVTIHRDIFSSYVQSTSMLKLQSGEITIKNLTLDGDASHAYTYLVSADNGSVSLTTENVNLLNGGELMGDETGAVKAAGAGYGAAVHLNNGATMVVKDGFFACTGGKEAGVFPFTGILVDSNGADVTFDLTDDSDTNPTVGIGSDLLLVGMPEAIDAETAQGILDEMKVPTRFIPYTLTLDDGSAYAFTGASPLGWNAIIDYGKEIMDVAGEMGYEGLDKEKTPIEVGLLTDTVLPDMFTFGDTNLTVNGNGNALSGEITYTDNAGLIENIELGVDGEPLVIDLSGSTRPVKMGADITVTDLVIKMTPEQAKSGKTVIAWPEGDKPENPENVIVAVVDPETSEPTGTKTLVWDEELRIAYIGPVEARLTGSNHEPVYTTLAEAMAQAESGDTVKMLSDVAQTNAIDVTTAVTLDLNGKAITAANGWKSDDPGNTDAMFAVVRGASLTVDDTTEDKLGKIDCSTSGADTPYTAIKLTKTGEPANGDVAAVTVDGGSVIGNYYGICGNDSRHDTAITVNGGLVKGTIENDCAGIFNPQNGSVTVADGTVEGATAIYAKSGTIAILGGKITATGSAASYVYGSGMVSTGDALVIDNGGNPSGTPIVSVTGGAFSSANNKVIGSYGHGESDPLEKFVSGGIYNKPVDQACIVEGKFSVDNTDEATKTDYPYAVGTEEPFAPLKVTFRDAVGEKPAEKVPFIVSKAWVEENFSDFVGTAEALKQAIEAKLDAIEANGLRGWQNYQLGFDGSEANSLSPDATAADDQVNVIVKSFRPVTLPKHDTGVVAQFVLRQGTPTRDSAGEITDWSWSEVQTQDMPVFSVPLTSLEVETYWRIKAVFSQASAK